MSCLLHHHHHRRRRHRHRRVYICVALERNRGRKKERGKQKEGERKEREREERGEKRPGVYNVILHKQDQLIFMHAASESAPLSPPRAVGNNKNRPGQTNEKKKRVFTISLTEAVTFGLLGFCLSDFTTSKATVVPKQRLRVVGTAQQPNLMPRE